MACGAISLRRHYPDQVLGVAVQLLRCRLLGHFERIRANDSRVPQAARTLSAPSLASQTRSRLHGAEMVGQGRTSWHDKAESRRPCCSGRPPSPQVSRSVPSRPPRDRSLAHPRITVPVPVMLVVTCGGLPL
jgi:hypothetical protein